MLSDVSMPVSWQEVCRANISMVLSYVRQVVNQSASGCCAIHNNNGVQNPACIVRRNPAVLMLRCMLLLTQREQLQPSYMMCWDLARCVHYYTADN